VKRLLVLAVTTAFIALLPFDGSALAATNAGGCQLHGGANFAPPLTNTAQSFNYSFSGVVTNCQSSSGGPTSGTVFAGTDGLPVPSGSGSCASSTTSGTAVVQWADGTTTVMQYTTTGAAAAVALQGSVIASVTSSTGTTYTTNRYAGDSAVGTLAFEPPDPTACAGAGVTAAGIDGIVGLGSG
jgi:hypothetical protein